MLIRRLVLLGALAGCTETSLPPDASRLPDPPPPLASLSQDSTLCDVRRYACDPGNAASTWICNTACGHPSHCREYNVIEIAFCATHPDYFFRLDMYCDAWGNPTWNTNCVDNYDP